MESFISLATEYGVEAHNTETWVLYLQVLGEPGMTKQAQCAQEAERNSGRGHGGDEAKEPAKAPVYDFAQVLNSQSHSTNNKE